MTADLKETFVGNLHVQTYGGPVQEAGYQVSAQIVGFIVNRKYPSIHMISHLLGLLNTICPPHLKVPMAPTS